MHRVSLFLRAMHPGIMLSFWWQLVLLVLSLLAYPIDPRKITGLNPWLKPIKFELSVAIFLLTIELLLSQLEVIYARPGGGRGWPALANLIGWTIAIAMIVENTLIAFQVLRGVRSHMNYTTIFDTGIFGMMAAGIVLNTIALWALSCSVWTPRRIGIGRLRVNAGARLGLAILILGSLEGVAMVIRQQHLVGAADSGSGIPFLNWSTTHGDLRVAHFFAIHAIQIFLLISFLLSRTWLSRAPQVALMVLLADGAKQHPT